MSDIEDDMNALDAAFAATDRNDRARDLAPELAEALRYLVIEASDDRSRYGMHSNIRDALDKARDLLAKIDDGRT